MRGDVNLAFEGHLVRVVDRSGDPWFIGKDVCGALSLRNHNDALGKLDKDERAEVAISDPSGTKRAIAVSEPGVYRLTFSSRKPEAERFKRWLAHEVLPELRKNGHYEAAPAPQAEAEKIPESAIYRLNLVREARLLFGPERARCLWRQLGLPAVPPAPATGQDEAAMCLRYLLDTAVQDAHPAIRDVLEQALDDDENARALLISAGIRPLPERDAFLIANVHPRLTQIFEGTDWAGHHGRVLRRLPGIVAGGQYRYGDHMQRRGSLVPARYLDPAK